MIRMKIGVIGTINRDSIRFADGTRKEGWGGILYNIVALSHIFGGEVQIVPVCNVGADHYLEVVKILKLPAGVDIAYVRKVKEKNNHCHLTYLDMENKEEVLKGGVPPLVFDDVEPLLDCDIILVNYISGKDIYLRSLQKLRRHFSGKIYIDIHSYTLGKRSDGKRYLRRPPCWPEVVGCGDFVQMNNVELSVIARGPEKAREPGGNPEHDLKTVRKVLRDHGIKFRDKVFVVTASSRGCYLDGFEAGRRSLLHHRLDNGRLALPKETVNSTGCGDCFAAGFVAGLVNNLNAVSCADAGNAAGLNRAYDPQKVYAILDKSVK